MAVAQLLGANKERQVLMSAGQHTELSQKEKSKAGPAPSISIMLEFILC